MLIVDVTKLRPAAVWGRISAHLFVSTAFWQHTIILEIFNPESITFISQFMFLRLTPISFYTIEWDRYASTP